MSRWHKTNCLDKKQLRSLASRGAMVILAQGPPWTRWACPKGACYQSLDANLLWALPFKVETLWGTQIGAKVLSPCILGSGEILSRDICDITKGSTWASPRYANPQCVFNVVLLTSWIGCQYSCTGPFIPFALFSIFRFQCFLVWPMDFWPLLPWKILGLHDSFLISIINNLFILIHCRHWCLLSKILIVVLLVETKIWTFHS